MQNTIEIQLIPVIITFTVTAVALFLAGYFALKRRVVLAVVSMACFLALFSPRVILANEICVPHHYPDGDTLYFKNGEGVEVRVRVAGFDAPERGQPFSRVATNKMKSLTASGAECDCYKSDRYGRSVCTVRTKAGENVAALMLGAGLGCIDPRFENEAAPVDRTAARAALENAQAQRRGMWSASDPVCGFDFRRSKNAK